MEKTNQRRKSLETLVLAAILTALVVVLQAFAPRFGPFAGALVLVPIVVGAATGGTKVSTWLGFVFSVVVLFTDTAAFMAISPAGTIITVLLKGTLCGFVSGLVYKLLEKKNRYLAVLIAAIACPVVNTGVFLLGCFAFFFEAIKEWGISYGFTSAVKYMLFGMVGTNFMFELGTNIVLCPAIVRILSLKPKD